MSLAGLFEEGRPASAAVATADDRSHDFARLREDVERLAGALRTRASREGARWVVACDDTYAFGVGLLGVWHAGGIAVSPPNANAGTLQRLADDVAGVVGDADVPGRPCIDALAPGSGDPARLTALDPEAWVLELFTSGTTGGARRARKRLRHLDHEVAWLERRWGARLGDGTVFSTASHQHLYGMLFRLLWPLAAGRCFRCDTVLHAEELVPRMRAVGSAALAATPAHLRRLAEHGALAELARARPAVFSSGGPLDPETADRLVEVLGEAPVEIFGSTETGGVAWRRQHPGPERLAFTPFEGVALERAADGRLRVRSPYGDGVDRPEGFVMGDRATLLDDGRFLLAGRADRTVKVGEKRLSLPDMEAELALHPNVSDAALLALAQEGPDRVAAVVVLDPDGRARLRAEGRRAIGAALGEHLARRFDRALVPRAWRYVDAIPEDAQGKRPTALLEPLFEDRGAASGAATEPLVLDETCDGGRIERVLQVPAKLAFFDGHYPVMPILPGVAQLAFAVDAARALLGFEPVVERIEALKFKEPVRPEDRLHLTVEHADGVLRFRLRRDERELASGRLVLRDAGGGPA